jgi:putative transposase
MAAENRLWGQKRIQAELAWLGFQVSARTVAKYMRGCRRRGPTGTWREFLTRHASNMWACDFFCVPTVLFQTLHVFFVIRLANREILHVAVTRHPIADWAAQQIVECCAWDRAPPRFLIHDRDSRYGANFDRRVRGLGIRQVSVLCDGADGGCRIIFVLQYFTHRCGRIRTYCGLTVISATPAPSPVRRLPQVVP